MFEKPKKKVIIKDGKRLLVDFDKISVDAPKKKDIVIEEEKLKEQIKKPVVKKKRPKKGKSLF